MTWPKTGATHYHVQLELLRQKLYNQRVSCLLGEWMLYTAIESRSMIQGAWRGLEPETKRHQTPKDHHIGLYYIREKGM